MALPLTLAFVALVSMLQGGAEAAGLRMPEAKDVSASLPISSSRGVWYGAGDQIPSAVVEAYGKKNVLPNCTGESSDFDYSHFNPMDPHYVTIFSADPANPQRLTMVAAGHSRTSRFSLTPTENKRILSRVNLATKDTQCFHWQPYVDMSTGELSARSVRKTEYERLSNGTVTTKNLNCAVTGTEMASCIKLGPNKVQAISIATYRCRNGECLAHSPAFQQEEHSDR